MSNLIKNTLNAKLVNIEFFSQIDLTKKKFKIISAFF